jgi:hypothetical protein
MISESSITISVNTYSGLIAYSFTDWYLIGAAVQGGWDNNADTNHQPMFRNGQKLKWRTIAHKDTDNFLVTVCISSS